MYDLPYLAHATMEPINCVADVRADRCEVWVGTQFQTGDRDAAAAEAGLKPEQVTLHTTLLGGGFGRRAVPDNHFVREAVQISRAVRAPVKVIWTREDDTRGGYYRPRAYHSVRAALDAAGSPLAWEQHVVVQSFLVDTPFAGLIKDGVDETAVEGAKDIPYAIPNIRVDWHQAPGGVPTLWWRSVGHSHTAFVVETLIDELAHAAGKDPLEFRRGLLGKHPRVKRVLEFVADKAGWGQPPPPGQGRGLAVHESFGSYVAHVAEVSVSDAGQVRVHRVVAAIDCGPVVNPDTIRAQLEGGTAFGLTAALYGEISFEKGRVKQRNFHDYPLLRINEMPTVEAHIVPSDRQDGWGRRARIAFCRVQQHKFVVQRRKRSGHSHISPESTGSFVCLSFFFPAAKGCRVLPALASPPNGTAALVRLRLSARCPRPYTIYRRSSTGTDRGIP